MAVRAGQYPPLLSDWRNVIEELGARRPYTQTVRPNNLDTIVFPAILINRRLTTRIHKGQFGARTGKVEWGSYVKHRKYRKKIRSSRPASQTNERPTKLIYPNIQLKT